MFNLYLQYIYYIQYICNVQYICYVQYIYYILYIYYMQYIYYGKNHNKVTTEAWIMMNVLQEPRLSFTVSIILYLYSIQNNIYLAYCV